MYDRLNSTAWRAWTNDDFELDAGAATPVLRLTSVNDASHPSDPTRNAYALEFTGPATPVYPQGTYTLRHAGLGELPVFIVPIGRNASAVIYEAVFT
jgi:hypothetical protein